jgi:pimeloyl-ACP methyl ester carboxylesterase
MPSVTRPRPNRSVRWIVLVIFLVATAAIVSAPGGAARATPETGRGASLARNGAHPAGVRALRPPKPPKDGPAAKSGKTQPSAPAGASTTSSVTYTQVNGHDDKGDKYVVKADQQNQCVYGDGAQSADISVPVNVGSFGTASQIDANGYPLPGNPLYGKQGLVIFNVYDVDDHANSSPAEWDIAYVGSPGSGNTYTGFMGFFTGQTDQPSVNSFRVDMNLIKPKSAVNPTGLNYVKVDVDTGDNGTTARLWCVAVNKIVFYPTVKAPLPVVFVHGMDVRSSAMDTMFTYYKNTYPALDPGGGQPTRMANAGGSDEQLDKYGGMEVRYQDVKAAVDQLLSSTGATRVNLVAHSFGGLVSRFYAYKNPQKVANVVMLGTPNGGSRLADIGCKFINAPWWATLDPRVRAVKSYVESKSGPCKFGWATWQLRQDYLQQRDLEEPDPSTVNYFTYAGNDSTHGLQTVTGWLLGSENDTLVTTDSAYWLRPGPAPQVGKGDNPGHHGHEIPQKTYPLYHSQLHEDGAPINDTFCKLYPEACPQPPLGGSSVSRKAPASAAAGARAEGTRTVASIGDPGKQISSFADLSIDPGASADVPLTFEGATDATVDVVSDHPESLSGSFGGTPLQLGEFLPDVQMLGVQLTAPADGPLHLTNNGSVAAAVRVLTGIDTSRSLTLTPSAQVVSPGGSVTFQVDISSPDPGDAPHLEIANESQDVIASLDATPAGTGSWTAAWTPPAAGAYSIRASVTGARPRSDEATIYAADGAATLGSGFTTQTVDDDGDSLYDALIVRPTVNVTTAGTYAVAARLVDASGNEVASADTTGSLAAGSQTVDLRFDGSAIYSSGHSGPYHVVDVSVEKIDDTARPQASAADIGATSAYAVASFQHDRVTIVPGQFSDQGRDSNGDGLYDDLLVTMQIKVENAGDYDIYGQLTAPDGTEVASRGAISTLTAGTNTITLAFFGTDIGRAGKAGPYKLSNIEVTSTADLNQDGSLSDAYTTAPYTLSQFAGADVTGTLTVGGAAVPISVPSATQYGRLTFAGTANQRVTIAFTASSIASGTSELRAADGRVVGSTSLGTTGGIIDNVGLPSTGTYTVVIDPSGSGGSVTVQAYTPPADATATATVGGSAVTVTTTKAGQNARVTFTGTLNQRVSVKMTSTAVTAGTVYLLKPDGTTLASAAIGTSGAFIDPQTLPVAGTYTVYLDPAGIATGGMTVTVSNASDVTGTIRLGKATTITTTTAGQNAKLTFSGSLNQKVSIKMTSTAITSGTMSLLKPDNSTFASAPITSTGSYIDTQTLPVAGTYTILLDPAGTQTGAMTVNLYDASDVTGTITAGGAAVTKSTTNPGQGVRLTFTGSVNQRVSVKATTASGITSGTVSLLKPDGSTLASGPIASSAGFLDAVSLTVAGTYTILVDPDAAQIGSTTVNLYNVTDVSGTITPGGAAVPVSITTPGQNAKLTFSGVPGQRVSLTLTSSTLASATVKLVNPDASTLASTTIGTSGGSIPTQELAQSGTYSVVVDPSGASTGNVTVTLGAGASDVTGTITAGGPAVPVTISTADQNARLTFTGTAGQRVAVASTNSTISFATLSIRDSGWNPVSSASIGSGSGFLDPTTLPANGTYTVFLDPSFSYTGSVSLQLYTVPADTSGTIVAGGAAVTVTTTVPGQNAKLTFSGVANQRVSLKLTNDSMGSGFACTAGVSVSKPSGGQPLAQDNCVEPPAPPFFDTMQLPETGTYTITVDPRDATTGSLTLQLYDVPADTSGTIVPGGAAVTVTTTVPGQNAKLTFTGTQNQRVSLKLTNDSLGSGFACTAGVSVSAPSGGQPLAQDNCVEPPAPPFFDTMQLPETGTYTITVDPRDATTGSLTLQLYDVPADTTGTITPGGGPVTVTFGTPGQNGKLTFTAASGQFSLAESSVTLGSSACCSGKVSVVAGQTTELNPTYFGTFGASQSFSVSVGGTQTIVIDPQDDATGSVTFTLTQTGALLAFAPTATLRWLEALSPQSASSRRPH